MPVLVQYVPIAQFLWRTHPKSFWLGLRLMKLITQKSESGMLLESVVKRSWCEYRLSHSIFHLSASTVFLNECLTFVVTPLCVHLVKTVKQPIDLCLYQSQLLFNHLQFIHAHCREESSQAYGVTYITGFVCIKQTDIRYIMCVVCFRGFFFFDKIFFSFML